MRGTGWDASAIYARVSADERRSVLHETALRMADRASEALSRIDAALALHQPSPWGVCDTCSLTIAYPCPTAIALGVEPAERTSQP